MQNSLCQHILASGCQAASVILYTKQEVTFYLQEGYICGFPESFYDDYSRLLHWSWTLLQWKINLRPIFSRIGPILTGRQYRFQGSAPPCGPKLFPARHLFLIWKLKKAPKKALQQQSTTRNNNISVLMQLSNVSVAFVEIICLFLHLFSFPLAHFHPLAGLMPRVVLVKVWATAVRLLKTLRLKSRNYHSLSHHTNLEHRGM